MKDTHGFEHISSRSHPHDVAWDTAEYQGLGWRQREWETLRRRTGDGGNSGEGSVLEIGSRIQMLLAEWSRSRGTQEHPLALGVWRRDLDKRFGGMIGTEARLVFHEASLGGEEVEVEKADIFKKFSCGGGWL